MTQEIPITTRVLKEDALLDGCGGKLVATEEHQEHLNYPEEFAGSGNLSHQDTKDIQEFQGTQETPEAEGNDKDWPHHFRISSNFVPHMNKVFSIVWQRYGGSPTDPVKDLDVTPAIW